MNFTRKDNSFLALDGKTVAARIDFTRSGDIVNINHTGTESEYRGQGLAGRLTEYALDEIAAAGLKVKAVCPYTVKYFAEHPEREGLLA